MTNLEIIKHLAANNPARLAVFLDDIYCNAWNCGAYAQRYIEEDKISELEMEFSESKWLEQEANTDFFFAEELEEWPKAISPISTIEAFYGTKSKVIEQAIDEIKLLETLLKENNK